MDSGFDRAVTVWHRRSGKDKTAIALISKKMWERKGVYYYLFPTYNQGRKILWDGMDRGGFKFTDHIPEEVRESTNHSDMKITMKNGSIFQVIGTDKIDAIVGTNPVGCVFSEYSLQNPQAWEFIRPILAENGGWALFNYTPRGKNHGYDLYEMARNNPKWFCELLTVDDTGAVSPTAIQDERDAGMDEDLVQQEFYCSFNAAIQGAYYAKQLLTAKEEGRITKVPHEEGLPVDTWWDIGIADAMSVWFTQEVGRELHVIDYYEVTGEGMPYMARLLNERGYIYGTHFMPHDADAREVGTGITRKATAESLGIRPIKIVPRIVQNVASNVAEGIHGARMLFGKCWFDEEKCRQGLNALHNYHKEWDEVRKEYKNTPFHDWSSHAADAFRYMAVGYAKFKGARVGRARQIRPNLREFNR